MLDGPPAPGFLQDTSGVMAPGQLGGEKRLTTTWLPSPQRSTLSTTGLRGLGGGVETLARGRRAEPPQPAFTLPHTLLP